VFSDVVWDFAGRTICGVMNSRICICCGEPMAPENLHSRYAHVCASCASFLDGETEGATNAPVEESVPETAESETAESETRDAQPAWADRQAVLRHGRDGRRLSR